MFMRDGGGSSDSAQLLAGARQGLWFRDYNVPRVLRLVGRYPDLGVTLGNPSPESDGCFTQDRVRMLNEVMEEADRGAMERLMEHPWGYPVELESVVMRGIEVCEEGIIDADDLDIAGFPEGEE